MEKIKLSILIPTYNREDFIKDALDSVLNQPFEDFEIICSDNSSEDSTYEILLEYAAKDKRIKVYQNEENLGPVLNWKNCLDHASGEFIHWLWSDDWIEANFYEDAFNLMESEQAKIVTAWNYRSDNLDDINDKYLSWQFSLPKLPGFIASKKILLLRRELPVSPAAYILPRNSVIKHFYMNIPSVSEKLNPVAKGVGVDSLMVIGCCNEHGKISVLRKPSVVFRKHENISTQLSRDGSLTKMYMISHLWFMSNNSLNVTRKEFMPFLLRVAKTFRFSLFHHHMLRLILRSLMRVNFLGRPSLSVDNYKSKKVFFKRD